MEQQILKVDSEGVPCMVQTIKFNYSWYGFDVKLFNGEEFKIDADDVVRILKMSLMQHEATDSQIFEAYENATKLFNNIYQKKINLDTML